MIKTSFDFKLAPIFLGFITWILIALDCWTFYFFNLNYVQILVLSAPLFLIPLSLKKENESQQILWFAFFFSLFIVVSFYFERGMEAGYIGFPWVSFCLFLLIREINRIELNIEQPIGFELRLMALFYLFIGSLWLIADRIDYQPLGFDPMIVLLTVAHFQFASFLLLITTKWIVEFLKTKNIKWISWFVISGVLLVAIGITMTQLGFSHWIETLSVLVMVFAGFTVGFLHLLIGWQFKEALFGWLWITGGIALMIGMSLALLYGLRNIVIIPFLTIPWMYVVHGTLNAVGFAFPVILGWGLYEKR